MADTLSLQPTLLRWARERASLSTDELARRVNLKAERVAAWESTGQITFPHLQRVAEKTHTPVGFLFLPEPPLEELPIRDFRTVDGAALRRPSPDLLDTLYACQQRQSWFRDYLIAEGEPALPFVGSVSLDEDPIAVAARIRTALGLGEDWRPAATFSAAVSELVGKIEALGVLVMLNGVVGNNTHRKLNVEEFRGFALCDEYAPFLFVNAADAKSAQMFTLAHELTHVWLGQSGVSDVDPDSPQPDEQYCNAVAAEVLVPLQLLTRRWQPHTDPAEQAAQVAFEFKVSAYVVLLRARDAGLLSAEEARRLYRAQQAAAPGRREASGGGNFYAAQGSRLGKRFARAVIASTLEGRTPYTEAFRLLGLKKAATFDEMARRLGVLG